MGGGLFILGSNTFDPVLDREEQNAGLTTSAIVEVGLAMFTGSLVGGGQPRVVLHSRWQMKKIATYRCILPVRTLFTTSLQIRCLPFVVD